jgi:predicted DCC family thiol-disulfide oxidoreductase YuxK
MYLDSLKNISSKLTIYYDGQCPLCLAEIHFLKHHNQKKLLDFVSLQALGSSDHEINCELAFKTIHARLGEKKIITGPEVFFEAYKRTDLKVINFLFSFRLFRFFYAKFYAVFAKNRHKISKILGPTLLNIVQRKYPEAMK